MFDSDKDSQVVETWQRFVQGLLGVLALIGAGVLAHYYAPPETASLEQQVHQLSQQVAEMERQGAFSPAAVDDARESVGYIYGIYRVSGDPGSAPIHARVAGTGFIVGPGLIATNRHVAEPWYGDREAAAAIRHGATPILEKLEAYFPGSPIPVVLHPVVLAQHGDLAVLQIEPTAFTEKLKALPLASGPPRVGEPISVLAYPMGVTGMVAKSPAAVYERLSSRQDDAGTAGELAALSLIRPSATFGHIGDVSGDKLIYDAPTARGGSGGPVLNTRGEVVGINSAYLDGFSGGTLGIAAYDLIPLVEKAKRPAIIESATSR
ncbi:MAG: trypsin-like peptidase domain-containing protein [Acidobacteria bacterium]|nr:trypsin-like peptidase domain-containing protein [Acidobacteriota bacterium]